MSYSASDITSVNVTAGTSATAANKSVSCSSTAGRTICVAWGVNANVISNGTVATVTFQLASGIVATSETVGVTNVVASTAAGVGIPASGVGSTISVTPTSLWTISGNTSSTGSGATVTLSGAGSATATADASGIYSFGNLANGAYTVTPSKSGYTFSPANKSVTISGANVTAVNFTATLNATPDFTLSPSPSSKTVTQGGSTTYSVAINATGGFTGQVNLSLSGLPSGATGSFNPSTATTSSTLSVTTGASTPTGTYTLTITGVSGTLNHTTTVTLVVSSSTVPDFTLTGSPLSQTVTPGGSTSYNVTITPTGGFGGTVTLSVSGLPSGATGSFTPNPVATTSTLSVATSASTLAGPYTLTITGTSSGTPIHTTTVSLVVSTAAGPVVTYDNRVGSGFQSGSSQVTTPPFTIGSGANRAAMIMISMSSNKANSITASLGGVAGTLIPGTDSVTNATIRTMIFQVINPPSGSQTATVAWRANGSLKSMRVDVGVITVSGADQTAPCINGTFAATNSAPAPTTSVSITSTSGDLTASVGYTSNMWMTPFTSQMLKWGIDSNAAGGDIGRGLGTTMHTWTGQFAGESHAVSGANFKAALAGLQITSQTSKLRPTLSGAPAAMRRTENAAQLKQSNVCSPGGLATLSGKGFTTQDAQKATSFPLPGRLAGVQVLVNGAPAPLLFVSDSQVNFQCPLLPPGSPLEVSVEGEDGASTPLGQSAMQAAAPGLFTVDTTTSQGVVLIGKTNEIAMPKTDGIPSRPARKGEFVTLYANGLGEVIDGVPIGTPAPLDRLVLLNNKVSLMVGGVEIEPAFAGLASGTAGLFQVNAQLPQRVPFGPAIPLYIKVILADGSVVVSNTVSMAIDDLSAQ